MRFPVLPIIPLCADGFVDRPFYLLWHKDLTDAEFVKHAETELALCCTDDPDWRIIDELILRLKRSTRPVHGRNLR